MLGSYRKILREGKSRWIRLSILLAFSAVLVANSLVINSSIVGTVASFGFLSLISVTIGEVFYSTESLFFKCLFGLATFLLLLAISGFGLMLIGKFTEILSLVVVAIIGVFFGIISLRRKDSRFQNPYKGSSEDQTSKRKDLNSYLMILIFLGYVAVAFRFLFLARTDEGYVSVWLEISPFFIPAFLLATWTLCSILFFTSISDGLKLVLLSVYTFLAHSLFWIVWYPSRYGDPLRILGHARHTARTGTIYAFDWMASHFLIEGIIMYRAQLALTVFFERMFSIDIYWVHIVLIPLLWSIFVPCLAYKVAVLLTTKRSRAFPLLAALSTGLFPSLILWGTVSVPNSLGFIFFFLSVVLLLRWMNSGGKWNWFVLLLTVVGTFLCHPQPGIFALMLFAWGNIVHRSSRRVLKIASLLLMFALYPVGLYYYGASFSPVGLFVFDNFLSFQSEITTIFSIFGLLGVVFMVRRKYVNVKRALLLFAFYVTVLFEYYLTEFGMTDVPFGPVRILVMGDLLLLPFAALGLLAIVDILRKVVSSLDTRVISSSLSSKKSKLNLKSRLIALALICLYVSVQATSTLYQAYPLEELLPYQPSAYMIEAIQYIDADAPGRYVVMCDPMIATVAIGFLGIDYGWPGGVRGFFGMPDWKYPTVEMYTNMTKQPSISIMRQAMDFGNASVSYFVVWMRRSDFERIVQQTAEILPVNRVFNSSRLGVELSITTPARTLHYPNAALAIFKYPLPIKEEPGSPVKVIFDDGSSTKYVETRITYMFETEINSTLTLSGYTSYNITDYPMHWTFLDLRVNNASRRFDEASDINTFVYVKGLEPDDVLTVKWQWNRYYSSVTWKEDSFKKGWRTHDIYTGTITPTIATEGNILNISYSFTPGPYLYYYYIKAVNITAGANQSIMVRWRSDGPIAVVAYYFELGLTIAKTVVPLGSKSIDWQLTIFPLEENMNITYVMVGISNLWARDLSEMGTLSIDYILIVTSTIESG